MDDSDQITHRPQGAVTAEENESICHLYSNTIESPCFSIEKNASTYQIRQYQGGEVRRKAFGTKSKFDGMLGLSPRALDN
jgi:hypothetical protein